MKKTKKANTEFNEMVKQGNFTKKVNTILSRLFKNNILSCELRELVIQIINLLNILNLDKTNSDINNKIKLISKTNNIKLLSLELNSLKVLLEDIKSPKNDFNNIVMRKSLTKEASRKEFLTNFVRELFENACKEETENINNLFELLGNIEEISNTEYIYNHFITTTSDEDRVKFLLQQLPFIGKTTKSNTAVHYVGTRAPLYSEIQKISTNIIDNNNITNIQVLFNGAGGEFSSLVPILDNYKIEKIGLNDINKSIQNLNFTIQTNPNELKKSVVNKFKSVVNKYGSLDLNKEEFKIVFTDLLKELNSLETNKIYNEETAALVFILLNWSFSGNYELKNSLSKISVGSCMKKYTNHKLFQKIDLFHHLYNKYPVCFTTEDYKEIVEREDSLNTCFFNDSPFMVESKSLIATTENNKSTTVNYGFKNFNHLENLKVTESIIGSFIYFNYVNPHIIECVKRNHFNIRKINKTIRNSKVKNKNKRTTKTEVIVYSKNRPLNSELNVA